MLIGTVKETYPGERRVALTPDGVRSLVAAGLDVIIESGAGRSAGLADQQYEAAGARLEPHRRSVFAEADVICQIRTLGANPDAGVADLELMRAGQYIIGLSEPLTDVGPINRLAETGVRCFALELIPRITRAQSMDVLSSQATISGYKAVLLAAMHLPHMFPMMMTAAGTLPPARAFVIGAGVAGLQAIATARRAGAVVTGYDIRPVVKEQVESLGARFLEIDVDAASSEDKGGYAKAMDDVFYRRQRELMARAVADNDVVITTAAVPGRKAPILVTADMVRGMAPGSVIVDLAAERGGNCELTVPDRTIDVDGVTIIGACNVPSTVPADASRMFARNVVTLLLHLIEDGELELNMEDEITEATLLTRDGRIVQRRVRDLLGLDAPAPAGTETDA